MNRQPQTTDTAPDATQPGTPPATWPAAVSGFSTWLVSNGRTSSTADAYARHVLRLSDAYPLTPPWNLTRHQVETWLEGHGWARGTRARTLNSVRHFYAWAVLAGHCAWSPVAGVQLPDARRSGPARREVPGAWDGPLGDYLQVLRAGARTPATIAVTRGRLSNLARHSADPWTITSAQLLDWIASPDWSPETRRSARSCVTGFYRWAVLAGHLDRSPADALPVVRTPRALPRPAPTPAVRHALGLADDRLRLAIKIAALAGLRRSEVTRLHYSNVDADVLHVIGKGGHHRRVPIAADLANELVTEQTRRALGRPGSGFPANARPDGYVFPSATGEGPITAEYLGKLVNNSLPDGWTMHTLRHRFATQTYSADRDLRAVQELLGHAKPETTARYAAVPHNALTSAVANVTL